MEEASLRETHKRGELSKGPGSRPAEGFPATVQEAGGHADSGGLTEFWSLCSVFGKAKAATFVSRALEGGDSDTERENPRDPQRTYLSLGLNTGQRLQVRGRRGRGKGEQQVKHSGAPRGPGRARESNSQ